MIAAQSQVARSDATLRLVKNSADQQAQAVEALVAAAVQLNVPTYSGSGAASPGSIPGQLLSALA